MSPRPESPKAQPTRRSGVVVPEPARWPARIGARIVHGLISAIALSLRWSWEDRCGFLQAGESGPVIFAIWHNRLALSLVIYRKGADASGHNRRLAGLVSASRDGGILARVMELFGVIPIRGSSSRRGAQALRELTTAARQGHDLAITPDGPRGPRYQVQEGVILAAQLTGLRIVPASYHLGWKVRLRSWDAFQIPLPFSTCRVTLGESIAVPRDAPPEQREELRRKLESCLQSITSD